MCPFQTSFIVQGTCSLNFHINVILFYCSTEEDHEGDSNLLPSDHDILSDVLQEEFGAAETESKIPGKKFRKGSQNFMEKYLMPSEALTCDTDTEVSNRD